jgi:hypothetical protein
MENLILVTCPNCNNKFNLEDGLHHDIIQNIEEKLNTQYQSKFEHYERQLKSSNDEKEIEIAKVKKAEKDNFELTLKLMRETLQDNVEKEREERKKEKEEHKREIAEMKELFSKQLIERDTQLKAQLLDKENELSRLKENNDQIVKAELEKREALIFEAKDKEINELKLQTQRTQLKLEEAQNQINQKNVELQGEALELKIEEILTLKYKSDEISSVKKGQLGADITQKVMSNGRYAGTIVIEVKSTKEFSKDWVSKLRTDILKNNIGLPLIITKAFPRDSQDEKLIQIDGVWIVKPDSATLAIDLLRQQMIKVSNALNSQKNIDNKMERLYGFLISDNFSNVTKNIIITYENMETELNKEMNAMQRIWKGRKEQIEKLKLNTNLIVNEIYSIIQENNEEALEALDSITDVKLIEQSSLDI